MEFQVLAPWYLILLCILFERKVASSFIAIITYKIVMLHSLFLNGLQWTDLVFVTACSYFTLSLYIHIRLALLLFMYCLLVSPTRRKPQISCNIVHNLIRCCCNIETHGAWCFHGVNFENTLNPAEIETDITNHYSILCAIKKPISKFNPKPQARYFRERFDFYANSFCKDLHQNLLNLFSDQPPLTKKNFNELINLFSRITLSAIDKHASLKPLLPYVNTLVCFSTPGY